MQSNHGVVIKLLYKEPDAPVGAKATVLKKARIAQELIVTGDDARPYYATAEDYATYFLGFNAALYGKPGRYAVTVNGKIVNIVRVKNDANK